MADEFLYGEVPEHFVPPGLLAKGKAAFDYCIRRYGDGGRPLRLRWLKNDKGDYGFAKIGGLLKELGGKRVDRLERSYFREVETIYGVVRHRSFSEKSPGPSIFVTVETPIGKIARTVGHEFYHWRYSAPGLSKEADEKAAEAFGVRVEKEMGEEAAHEADEKWRAKFREVQSRRK